MTFREKLARKMRETYWGDDRWDAVSAGSEHREWLKTADAAIDLFEAKITEPGPPD